MRAGVDGSCSRLPAKHPSSALFKISIGHAHLGVHPIQAAVVARSPDLLFYLQLLKDEHLFEPEGHGNSQSFA